MNSGQHLLNLVAGRWASQAICAAAELEITDNLGANGLSVKKLAERLNCDSLMLLRLLKSLIALGIYSKNNETDLYLNNELSMYLSKSHPQSLHGVCAFLGGKVATLAWLELAGSIRSNVSGFKRAHGADPFTFYEAHLDHSKVFSNGMSSFSKFECFDLSYYFEIKDGDLLIDIGGGYGTLLQEILALHPGSNGIVLDLPSVILEASSRNHASNILYEEGDFFKSVPVNGSHYFLKHILHDFSDVECIEILTNIYDAARTHSKVYIIESLTTTESPFPFAELLDIEMLVMTGSGHERSLSEYVLLLQSSGFLFHHTIKTKSYLNIIVACKGS